MTTADRGRSEAGGASSRSWLGVACALIGVTPVVGACGAASPGPVSAAVHGAPVAFVYPKVDGSGDLDSTQLRGRPAVLIFVTTYDLASQAEARFLSGVLRQHDRPFGAAAIFLEPAEDRPLIVAFRDALNLRYTLVWGDAALIDGQSPFGSVSVPTTIVLDAEGRVAWRQAGLAKDADIERGLRSAERR